MAALSISSPGGGRSRVVLHREAWLSIALGLAIIGAMISYPMETAIAVIIVAAFVVFLLFNTWYAVILLLVARSSLDLLADVAVVSSLNGAALLTAAMVAVGFDHIARNRIRVFDLPLTKPFLALLLVSAFTIAMAPDIRLAFEHWIRLLSTFLLFTLIVSELHARPWERYRLLGAVLLSAVIPLIFGLFQLATNGGDQATEGFNRIYGTFVHPSPYGVYLLTLLPLAAVVWFHQKPGWLKLALGLLAILLLVSSLFTFTRIVWVGLLVGVLVMASIKARAALLVIPIIVVAAIYLLPSVQDRFEGATQTTGYESSGAWRIRHWDDQLATTSPSTLPFGSGLGAVEYVLGQPAHNDYLRIWVELGLFGSIASIWLYGSLAKNALASYRDSPSRFDKSLIVAFLAMFSARLVMSLTDNLLIQPVLEWYFWAIAAMTVAVSIPTRRPAPLTSPGYRVRP